MKISTYIKLMLLLFFGCNNSLKKTDDITNFNIKASYIGNSDKPLPILNFFKSCEESFTLNNYNYELNDNSFNELKKEITKQGSKVKMESSLIHIVINKKEDFYLNKDDSLSFILLLLDTTMYKNNKQLNSQLNLYLRVLKHR